MNTSFPSTETKISCHKFLNHLISWFIEVVVQDVDLFSPCREVNNFMALAWLPWFILSQPLFPLDGLNSTKVPSGMLTEQHSQRQVGMLSGEHGVSDRNQQRAS